MSRRRPAEPTVNPARGAALVVVVIGTDLASVTPPVAETTTTAAN